MWGCAHNSVCGREGPTYFNLFVCTQSRIYSWSIFYLKIGGQFDLGRSPRLVMYFNLGERGRCDLFQLKKCFSLSPPTIFVSEISLSTEHIHIKYPSCVHVYVCRIYPFKMYFQLWLLQNQCLCQICVFKCLIFVLPYTIHHICHSVIFSSVISWRCEHI